jgi:hypothetical protein
MLPLLNVNYREVMNGIEDRPQQHDPSHDSRDVPCGSGSYRGWRVDDGFTATEGTMTFAGGNDVLHIKALMPGNQSFDRSLYAPLTRALLVCRPEVNFA